MKPLPKRLLSGSFWLIMLIHLVVFTAIGLFSSKGWGLLLTFLSLLAASLFLGWLVRRYLKHRKKD